MSHYFQNDPNFAFSSNENSLTNNYGKIMIYLRALNDKIQFFKLERWVIVGVLVLFYFIRLIMTGGYHAVTYCLGIHLLNAFIGFISPLEDPDDDEIYSSKGSFLPQK